MAEAAQVPILGIGPSAALERQPSGCRPSDLLPGARSVVCFAVPVPRSVYQAPRHAAEMIWRSQNTLYRRLDTLSLAFAQAIEAAGAGATPVFGCCPMAVDRAGRITGYVSQLLAAQLTGIGRIGRSGLLLHRRYGPRLMLGGVVTTIDLPPVRIPDLEHPDCPPGCTTCIDSCPARAISRRARRVDAMRCLAYAARTPLLSRLRFVLLSKLRPEAAALLMNTRAFDEHTMHVCSACVVRCPYGEE